MTTAIMRQVLDICPPLSCLALSCGLWLSAVYLAGQHHHAIFYFTDGEQ